MKLPNKRITETHEVGAPFELTAAPIVAGSFEITPRSVRCDEPYVLRIRYTVDERGIAEGGGLQVRWAGAQSEDAEGRVYIAATASRAGASFRFMHKGYPRVFITTPQTTRHGVNRHAAVLQGTALCDGDTIEIMIGTAGRGPGAPRRGDRSAREHNRGACRGRCLRRRRELVCIPDCTHGRCRATPGADSACRRCRAPQAGADHAKPARGPHTRSAADQSRQSDRR